MRTVLDNGLTVVLQENRTARVAAMQLWVKVGSADESEEEAGLAHLHEHMLFKGTERRGPGEIARVVEACGGNINAWTSFDQTVYHLVLPSDAFADGLDILADVVTDSVFDPGELSREIEVVLEEILRADDMPARRVSRNLFGTAYQVHPYRRPVIGFESTVRSFSREKILEFYHRHYVAPKMVFTAVGDFEEARALDAIQHAFSRLRTRPPEPPRARPAEPKQQEPRARFGHAPVRDAYFALGWHIPGLKGEDVAALDLLAILLGQGDASRLALEVKRDRALVNEVHASAFTPQDPGLLAVSAFLPPKRIPSALDAVLEQTYRLRHVEFSDAEVARAKRLIESDSIYQRETVQGQARKLGFFETIAGHVDEEERYLSAIAGATATDLRQAAERYLVTDNLTVSVLAAQEELKANDVTEARVLEVARTAHARANGTTTLSGPAQPYVRLMRDVNAAVKRGDEPLHRETLPGGITLLVKRDASVPLVSLRAAWMGGLRAESPENNGVNALLARCLVRGTKRRDARTIAREIDELAGGINGISGRNSFGVRGDFLAADLRRGFDLFADVMLHSALDEEEVLKERALVLDEIRAKEDSPASVAFSLFGEALYDRHPYRMDASGAAESVGHLNAAALRVYQEERYRLGGMVLSVVGDVTPEQIRAMAMEHLVGVRQGSAWKPEVDVEPPLERPREMVRRLDRKQAHLVIGFRGTTLDSPDRFPLSVLSSVLSGQAGRLFLELRDRRSLAYTVTSMSGEGIDPGYFAVYIGTSPEKVPEAKQGILDELDRIRQERVSEGELDRARRYLAGAHEVALQRMSSRAGVMALDEVYGVGAENYRQYQERVRAVTAEDVQNVARRIIDFDRSVTTLVSPHVD